ncbi:MAG: hypothetical protein HEP71_31735 [Roseivirga sp.]|nr:hypothetical protein [Roseivirga sp.]
MKILLTISFLMSMSFSLSGQIKNDDLYRYAERTGQYSYEYLLDWVEANITEKEDIALFFYYWIAIHMAYDDSISLEAISTSRNAAQSVQTQVAFKSRKTTCLGFTNLYNAFLQNFDIEHRLVLGYSRSPMNVLEEIEPQEDHAWSAIRWDDEWHLVEITWANLYINDREARDYYFKTDPAEMMLQHFPKDEKWQLLDEKWSFDKFKKAPLFDPWYLSRSIPGEEIVKTERNSKGELVINCLRPSKWKLSLKAINKYDEDQMNLKYKVKRSSNSIQFTIRKYDGKSPIRLDAIRIGVNSSEIKALGLAYFMNLSEE